MVETLKQKAQKIWGQLTPDQKQCLAKSLFYMGCAIFCKIAQHTWQGIGVTLVVLIAFTVAMFYATRFLQSIPRFQGILKWLIPVFVGGILNLVVILANGGFMPSACEQAINGFYIPMEGARLTFLADWIWTFVSPGDVLMFLAFAGIIATMLVKPRKTLVEQQ